MNTKSILMPHPCQIIGWSIFALSVISLLIKGLFIHDIDIAWYFAKISHVTFLVSFLLICMSKEKVEDEMISALRLKSAGITSYAFFILFVALSIILELKPHHIFKWFGDTLSAYLSEFLLICLPAVLFVIYYTAFKRMVYKTRK